MAIASGLSEEKLAVGNDEQGCGIPLAGRSAPVFFGCGIPLAGSAHLRDGRSWIDDDGRGAIWDHERDS